MTRSIAITVLFVCSLSFGQTCQTNTATLTDEQKSITGANACNPTGSYIDTITITDTYEDKTITTSQAVNPNVTVLDVSSSVTGTGSCSFIPPQTSVFMCPPIMKMNVTDATSTSDFNRFINLAIDQTITNLSTGTCGNADSGQRQDLKQSPGQACASTSSTDLGGGDGTCLGGSGSRFTSGGGGTTSPDCSPIIVDTTGRGFQLSSAADGVFFDIRGDGMPIKVAWPVAGSGNAFLALPASKGIVNNGTQLFGNFTPQPASPTPNGFAALAVYDLPSRGGNGDGVIDQNDQIFSSLRLWIDANRDGICQPEELHTLPELGVQSISLTYNESDRLDQFGNFFRFKAKVNPNLPGDLGAARNLYDVFLTAQ